MSATVYYEAEDGKGTYSPNKVHTEAAPLVTLLWYNSDRDGVAKKVQLPASRIIRVVYHEM